MVQLLDPSPAILAQFPPAPLDGSNGDQDDRLDEVHARARVSIAKSADAARDKRRHQAREGDVSVHT
jgi:hypothetical protein